MPAGLLSVANPAASQRTSSLSTLTGCEFCRAVWDRSKPCHRPSRTKAARRRASTVDVAPQRVHCWSMALDFFPWRSPRRFWIGHRRSFWRWTLAGHRRRCDGWRRAVVDHAGIAGCGSCRVVFGSGWHRQRFGRTTHRLTALGQRSNALYRRQPSMESPLDALDLRAARSSQPTGQNGGRCQNDRLGRRSRRFGCPGCRVARSSPVIQVLGQKRIPVRRQFPLHCSVCRRAIFPNSAR